MTFYFIFKFLLLKYSITFTQLSIKSIFAGFTMKDINILKFSELVINT